MWLNSLKSMVPLSGGNVKRKTSCQKDLRIRVHQMANLQKKQISWTSGLTQVHHGMGLWLIVQNSNTQLIFTLKVQTNTVVGSTHLSSLLWPTMVSHHTNKSCLKVSLWMEKVRRCLNLLEIPLLQVMLKSNLVLKSCVSG